MMILVWLLIGLAIYYLLTNNNVSFSNKNIPGNAENILKERYAKGEIDEVTYERMQQNINR